MHQLLKFPLFIFIILAFHACTGIPKGIEPVSDFKLDRYLGVWYEIARLDHSFERGLNQISANYSMREDGGVSVLNRGFSIADQAWDEAQGKAYFVGDSSTGHLKVSFFGPFYASYVIAKLDQENYSYAYITGPDHSYLWLLSRSKTVSEERKQDFIEFAQSNGFEANALIWVEH